MTQEFFFKKAKWVGAPERTAETFSVLRSSFETNGVKKATLNVLGLGFFKCYINGKCINPDTFLPVSSDFENTCDPVDEVISGHRIYVPQFDVTEFLADGKNSLALHYGGGWYTVEWRVFGLPKAIFCLTVEDENGVHYVVSDENCRVGEGCVSSCNFIHYEHQNLVGNIDCLDADFDDSGWDNAAQTEELNTEYCTTDCPWDKLIEKLPVKVINETEDGIIFDCGENTTGYPVLKIKAEKGEKICVDFAEEIMPDGTLDPEHMHGQQYTVVSDGKERLVQPEFAWFGFRYFKVKGNATPECVKVVHADVPVSSTFDCDNETLNWTYKTFMHTMLCNMHTGHPSDCPHLERRGYTGDG